MSGSKDRKGLNPSVSIPEEEQSTFGQQSPYAAGFNNTPSSTFPITSSSSPSAHPTTATSSQPSTVTSPQQHLAPAATGPFAIPTQQDAQHYPEGMCPIVKKKTGFTSDLVQSASLFDFQSRNNRLISSFHVHL
jgi:hypothetical protein